MDKLFNPTSIAVIGASRHKEKLGYQILYNIIQSGFAGYIYPINPEAREILGKRSYRKITDIEGEINLAIVAVPANIVPEVLADCVEKNVNFAVVISAGFSEIGKKGQIFQDEIKDVIIKTSPLRVLGPNCLGIINTSNNLNATFAAPALVKGNVAAVFQSGALGVALLDWAKTYEFGFSKFVSLGNKVDVEESEILEYLGEDEDTKVIAVYLENIANPKKFLHVARRVAAKKPIVILKGGTTKMGQTAAFSHTAAMVTPDHLTQAIFIQSNLIVARTIEEMLSLIQLLSCEPAVSQKKLAVITNAGGPGILATDAASQVGLNMPLITPKTEKSLKKVLPEVGSIANPLDLAGEALACDYENALSAFINEPQMASILVLLTPQTMTEVDKTAEVLVKYAAAKKPIVAAFLGDRMVKSGIDILRKGRVPYFDDPEAAVRAIEKVTRYWNKFLSPKDFIELSPDNKSIESAGDALELLDRYNIPIPPSGMATTMDVVMKIVGRIGMPVVVKNISHKFIHKFKAGKVVLNVQSEAFLKQSVEKVGFPVLIQRMVESPFEIIIGAKREEKIGTILTFGWGGVFTEDIGDISAKILPLTEYDLDEMIKETKIGKILMRENIDLSGLKNILVEVSQIMTDYPEISEIDLNPVKVMPSQVICVDARYK